MLADNVNIWGLHPFYTHQSANQWRAPDPFGAFGVNGFGGSISASFLAGRLGLDAMGGYYAFSCEPGVDCKGGVTGGGSAFFLRALTASSDSSHPASLGLPSRHSVPSRRSSDRSTPGRFNTTAPAECYPEVSA